MGQENKKVKPLLPLSLVEVQALRRRLHHNPEAKIDPQVVARLLVFAEAQAFVAGSLKSAQRRRAAASARVRRVLQ